MRRVCYEFFPWMDPPFFCHRWQIYIYINTIFLSSIPSNLAKSRYLTIDCLTLFLNWYKRMAGSFFVPAYHGNLCIILPGAFRELDEECSEVPEDSRVLRVRCLWFPTSNRLQTWLIPSGTTRFRPMNEITIVWRSVPPYDRFGTLSCPVLLKERDKAEVSTIRGGTRAGCIRPWLTRCIV